MYNKTMPRELLINSELEDELDMRKILKDIERLGSSTLTWKERKKLENKNVVALGGKPTKSHRMPLSVAKPMMKNTKRREEKKMEEEKLLGVFTNRKSNSKVEKRQPEDKVLKATEGYFSKGVLNVKHLLEPKSVKRDESSSKKIRKHKKRKGKKKSKGKRKGR
ncbi:uncharacterized protein LOC110093426 [Dendrobium catenatum]|uniref:Uncharacterized protein n=1 Tax=Dendrobium catenatum TaxID=906689 RepID=A0A2I0W838_9ASPA|nr:uncharacterized protein LOC110093426 [Dendrobium catenatum]XP_020673966.1 uncharacterized protein LOC110093426 [Dendrobium catenatum]PKU71812.1 hypothetical protein MA16_Dca008341 [Dendrobium catenatum]